MVLDLQVIEVFSGDEQQDLLELMQVADFFRFFFNTIFTPLGNTFLPHIFQSGCYVV